jgi:hypothetical protein
MGGIPLGSATARAAEEASGNEAKEAAEAKGAKDGKEAESGRTGLPGAWLRETGRVGEIKVGRPGADLNPANGAGEDSRETPVRVQISKAESSSAVSGRVNPAVVAMEARPHVRALRSCPIEVARRRQVPLSEVRARDIELTFTIQTNGAVTDAQALAAKDADDDVLACVGRRMFGWRFTPPDGGPAKVGFQVDLQFGKGRTAAPVGAVTAMRPASTASGAARRP